MINLYQTFRSLSPEQPLDRVQITAVDGNQYRVITLTGQAYIATGEGAYVVGDYVFVRGTRIDSKAPANPVSITIEV